VIIPSLKFKKLQNREIVKLRNRGVKLYTPGAMQETERCGLEIPQPTVLAAIIRK